MLGVVHFIWKVKSDYSSPTRYAIVLAVLLLVRLSPPFRRR
jgi:DMSO/TMAO reductase YedYZ heme-binding membrane subunit